MQDSFYSASAKQRDGFSVPSLYQFCRNGGENGTMTATTDQEGIVKQIYSAHARLNDEVYTIELAGIIRDAIQEQFGVESVTVTPFHFEGDTLCELSTRGDPFTKVENSAILSAIWTVIDDWRNGVVEIQGVVKAVDRP